MLLLEKKVSPARRHSASTSGPLSMLSLRSRECCGEFDLLLFVYFKHQHQQHNSPVFQIDFVSRKRHPLHHDTYMGVDGTDCYIIWQKGCTFTSQKMKGKLAFPYEIAPGIISGYDIVWINGPFQIARTHI